MIPAIPGSDTGQTTNRQTVTHVRRSRLLATVTALAVLALGSALPASAGSLYPTYHVTASATASYKDVATVYYAFTTAGTTWPPDLVTAIKTEMSTLATSGGRTSYAAELPTSYQAATSAHPATLTIHYDTAGAISHCSLVTEPVACQYGRHIYVVTAGTRYTNYTVSYCELPGHASYCFSIKTIFLHEIGHAFGLSHYATGTGPGANITVMQSQLKDPTISGWNATQYGHCDMARLQLTHGPGSIGRFSPCLPVNMSSTMTLTAESGYDPALGQVVIFTASFRSSATQPTGYGVFSNLPLDSRPVSFERSTDGSTWTSAGTLSKLGGSSGLYRIQLKSPSGMYRAIYRYDPAVESLYGSYDQVIL